MYANGTGKEKTRNQYKGSLETCQEQSYCQSITHVQTARKSHDLNMDFCSFDNGFKQLCVTNAMQEYLHFQSKPLMNLEIFATVYSFMKDINMISSLAHAIHFEHRINSPEVTLAL